jgi:glyoxylase-like metal-dependent hydrolase (beta-lactamase superfamily II)
MADTRFTLKMSRRTLLKSIGVGAVAAALPAWAYEAPARAATPEGFPSALKRFGVGDFELTVMQDRVVEFMPAMFELGAPEGAVAEALARSNLPSHHIPTTVNPLLVDTRERLVLIDTGTGPFLGETFGRLLDTLGAIGVAPGAIDTVIISHWHPDHVGAASMNGEVTFPNAQYHFPRAEWEFVQDFPAGSPGSDMFPAFEAAMQPFLENDLLAFYDDGDEIVSGIRAMAAPGHTPGHHGFLISSNGEQIMSTKDVADNFLVSLLHPEWGFVFDNDATLASETRRRVFGRAADEGLRVIGYHFPFPGVGYVVREGDGFRFVPSV